jgi:hypothetical protein
MANTGILATVFLACALLLFCPSPVLSAATLELTWQERILTASGGGYQGPWHMNASVYDYVDDPAVAIDAQGSIGVVWADQGRKDIFFSASRLTAGYSFPPP